jgi:hypothetical protein
MQEPLDRLRALKNELEDTSFLNWDKVDIWGKKALPTIAKNWSEHLDEFKSLLTKPIYRGGARICVSRPDSSSPRYIFSPERYQEDQVKWLESERRNKQQSEREAAGYRQNCENAHKKILAFLDGIIHETENSVTMPATIVSPVKSINNRDMQARAIELRKIQIFLASSEELRDDRDKFEIYSRQLNDELIDKGLYLVINRWENFLDAMSETRLQDEYNKAVRSCDIFVSLFFTKTGKFTEEEFDTAHDQFKETGRPFIYTFFKDAPVNTGKLNKKDVLSLLAFQEQLRDLGHFYTQYTSTEDLKLRFRGQLDKLFEKLLRE